MLRMPLASATVQLDPETLEPLPAVPRAVEIARFITSLETTAENSPMDPFALAESCQLPAPHSRKRAVKKTTEKVARAAAGTEPSFQRVGEIDVTRLEQEGLYPGVKRNAAAMAMASRKMLALGWNADETVEFLVDWTEHMTNGLSPTAARLTCAKAEAKLRGEYRRISGEFFEGCRRAGWWLTSAVGLVVPSPTLRLAGCSLRPRQSPTLATVTECRSSCFASPASRRTVARWPSARRASPAQT
jgi:hypothetical protein